jgi:starvation-inducible DNA-binding protein
MQPTRNTLPALTRAQSVDLLNLHLAAIIDLRNQAKQAHWNVRGPNFIAIHKLFDRVAKQIDAYTDMIAERLAGLGGTAQGSVQHAASTSFLIPYPLGVADTAKHIFAIAGALAAFGQSTREAITKCADNGDADTADLLTEVSRGIDLQLWLVESHTSPQ